MIITRCLVAYFDQKGDCTAVVEANSVVVEGLVEEGLYAKNVDSPLSTLEILTTVYLTADNQLAYRDKKPSENHSFIDGLWVADLPSIRESKYGLLKDDLYKFIVRESDMPEWKQVNFSDRWAELSIKSLTSSLTLEEQDTLAYIASLRSWKNTLLLERERVKGEIVIAESEAEMEIALKSFQYTERPPSG